MTGSPRLTSRFTQWPQDLSPERVPVVVVNEIETAASPDMVWSILIRAAEWPSWYPRSSSVAIADGSPDLRAGVRFRWRTFGVDFRSVVEEFEPCRRIAWRSHGRGVSAYHAWEIVAREGRTIVRTEETQAGLLARLGKLLFHGRTERGHQIWLEELSRRALRNH